MAFTVVSASSSFSGKLPGTPTPRSVNVPRDKASFFPIFNAFAIEPASDNFTPEALCAGMSGSDASGCWLPPKAWLEP